MTCRSHLRICMEELQKADELNIKPPTTITCPLCGQIFERIETERGPGYTGVVEWGVQHDHH